MSGITHVFVGSKFWRWFVLVTGTCFFVRSSYAFSVASGSSSLLRMPSYEESMPQVRVNLLQLQNSQYLGASQPAFRNDAEAQDTSLKLRLEDGGNFTKSIYGKFKGKDEYSASEKWNYTDVHEAFVQVALGSRASLSLGRKLDNWSDWDSRWQQGMFQPRYLENRLRPEAAGLLGAFLAFKSDSWLFTFGALPHYVPDFGAHYEIQNDRFQSRNPWFHTPTSAYIYRFGVGNIHYSMDTPDASSVIGHGGGIGKIEFHRSGFFSRLTYAYKPAPQMLLGFPSNHQVVVANDSDYMNVEIHPRIVYDRIVNLDNDFQFGRWSLSLSVAANHPVNQPTPQDWTAQQSSAATVFSGAVGRRLEENGPHAARMELGFLKVNGGDEPDHGQFAGPNRLFERRFQFYEAYMVALKEEFRSWFKYPLESEARLIYDRLQNGGAISLNAGMSFSRNVRADMEFDILGLFSSNAASDGFLSTYRANDRVGLGVSYVF